MVFYLSLTVISLSLLLFIICQCLEGSDLIHDTCKKAAESDPILSYDLCVSSLEADPKSQNATLEQLGVISIELSISNATNIASHIKSLLMDQSLNSYVKTCLTDCLDLYSDTIPALQSAVIDLNSRDYDTANLEVSSAMDASSTCEDGFAEKEGVMSPLEKENNLFFQLSAIALAFTKITQ